MLNKSDQHHAFIMEGHFSDQSRQGDQDKPIGVDAIDRIGVSRIADQLDISKQAVRKWRQTEKIPDDRQDDLRALLRECSDQASVVEQAAEVAEVSNLADMVAVADRGATNRESNRRRRETAPQSLIVRPSGRPALSEINGQHASTSMELLIAARDVDQACVVVEKAAARADGLPPAAPVRGYKLRLGALFALDFPILTMAFASVTEASPIVAAGSAIALSLGLVLCAHAAGVQLRALAAHTPAWLRDLTTLVLMITLIAAVIGVATELRLKGYELDGALFESARAGIFGTNNGMPTGLPDTFTSAIVRAAGLVTILLTIFGISWSYQNHGPQRDFATAEKSYRRSLRRYASAVKKAGKTSMTAPVFAVFAIAAVMSNHPADASDCDGKSVLALVDTTTAYDDQDRQQVMPAIDEMVQSLVPGTRLVIRTIRDSPSTSRLLLDECIPNASAFEWSLRGIWTWLSTNPAAARAAHASFRQAIRDTLLPELRHHGDAPGTALIDTIAQFAADSELSAVWLFSDLLESVAVSTASLLTSSDSLIKASRTDLVLSRVSVYVAGVGRFHDPGRRTLTSGEYGSLIDAWAGFIRQLGGELHLFEEHETFNFKKEEKR